MRDVFWDNVDEVRVSLYPSVSPPPRALEKIEARARESNTRLVVTVWSQFRTTMVTQPHPADRTTAMIYRTCNSAHRCHMIHEGRLFKCAVPPFLPEFLSKAGEGGYDPDADAFDIHGAKDLFQGLKDFLLTRKTPDSCRYCLGWVGKLQPHHQLRPEIAADPSLEPVTRRRDLDPRRLALASLRYGARRVLEKVTGRPRW